MSATDPMYGHLHTKELVCEVLATQKKESIHELFKHNWSRFSKKCNHVSALTKQRKERFNRRYNRAKFAEFLARQKPSLVAFEACGSSHYWGRQAKALGHQVKIIPAKLITPYRQGHKTDVTDARAIADIAQSEITKLITLQIE